MTIVEIAVHGNIEALDRLHFIGNIFGFGCQHIFKKLIKITGGTLIIIGTDAPRNAIGQAVPANAIITILFYRGPTRVETPVRVPLGGFVQRFCRRPVICSSRCWV